MPGYGTLPVGEGRGLLPWSWAEERLVRSYDFWPPGSVSAADLAAETIRRAAVYRLGSEMDLDDDERAALERCRSVTAMEPSASRGKNHVYFHEMPRCWHISESPHGSRPYEPIQEVSLTEPAEIRMERIYGQSQPIALAELASRGGFVIAWLSFSTKAATAGTG
jgi:hypothetical protein